LVEMPIRMPCGSRFAPATPAPQIWRRSPAPGSLAPFLNAEELTLPLFAAA
jgi:hypothetical protein